MSDQFKTYIQYPEDHGSNAIAKDRFHEDLTVTAVDEKEAAQNRADLLSFTPVKIAVSRIAAGEYGPEKLIPADLAIFEVQEEIVEIKRHLRRVA